MKKVGVTQRRRTEKAIIDALLKISEIVQKTEISRQHQKSNNKPSKKIIGDGDCNEVLHDEHQQAQQVPVPPSTRTLDSFVSVFNQPSLEKSSNCSETSITKSKQQLLNPLWNVQNKGKFSMRSQNIRYVRILGQEIPDINDCKSTEHSYKRCYSDCSSVSLSLNDDHHRKKSSKHSVQSNKNLQPVRVTDYDV